MQMIGPYEIRGELGRGAMAVVWRGYDTRLEREVAIKEPVMPPGLSESAAADMAARFVQEGLAAARLNHPGIITVFTADVYDGRPVIVMERIDGDTLEAILRSGALAPEVAASVLDQLLDAIAYAHERGVVHRDIKPDNVFLTRDGRVKLADFGIARTDVSHNLTQAGTVLGTPGYMSPEQVQGLPTDARSDLFSVGAVAYEMVAGHNPFGIDEGAEHTAVMYRIVHEDVPDLAAVVSGAPSRLSEVVRMAMAKDPGFRFATAHAMREALHGGPLVAGGYGAAPTAVTGPAALAGIAGQKPGKGVWPYVAVGAVGVVVTVTLLVAATSGSTVGTPVPQASPEAPAAAAAMPAAAPAQPSSGELEAELGTAVQQWLGAWRSRDLGRYMAYYALDFSGTQRPADGPERRRDYNQWASWKSEVFATKSYQTVNADSLDVTVSGTTGEVTFFQTFGQPSNSGGQYSDFGYKEMTWAYRGGDWVITREDWTETFHD